MHVATRRCDLALLQNISFERIQTPMAVLDGFVDMKG